ncbi:hypothetical protein PAHAL_9G615700 [Panicum hallii]|uniref:Uncharacterized protein n=1 Tax=Panicum hallii TaxID=206008 RepID=A0A2T8I6J3_9POAL|nr:hypothetical protein PAHAL_9G615700 [Panicum hallii]
MAPPAEPPDPASHSPNRPGITPPARSPTRRPTATGPASRRSGRLSGVSSSGGFGPRWRSRRSGLGSDDALAAVEPDPDDACCFRSRRRSRHLRAGILGSLPPTAAAPFVSSAQGVSGCCAATHVPATRRRIRGSRSPVRRTGCPRRWADREGGGEADGRAVALGRERELPRRDRRAAAHSEERGDERRRTGRRKGGGGERTAASREAGSGRAAARREAGSRRVAVRREELRDRQAWAREEGGEG